MLGSAVIPRIGFPGEHARRFEDPPDLVQTVVDAELRLDPVLDFGGCPVFFLPEFFKQSGFLFVSEFRRVAAGMLRNQPGRVTALMMGRRTMSAPA
ncbi:MAG: hypothetical protein WBH07_09740 [Candidatus Methanoculleus thermohydrogenotrophicum]